MTDPDAYLPSYRHLLERVLRLEVTKESHPELFDEDVVLFAARGVETKEPEWILAQLGDSTLPMAGRRELVGKLLILFNRGLALLREEDPNVAPELKYR